MKITRKILAAFLAILFVAGTLSFSAFAEGTPVGSESMQVVINSQLQAEPGEVITVTINVTNNYYATNMRWPIIFTKSVFELIDEYGQPTTQEDYVPITVAGQLTAPGSSVSAIDATGKSELGSFSNSKYGALLFQWVGNYNNGVVNCYMAPGGSNCISFQLRVKEGVTSDKGTIQIPSELTEIFYYQAMNNPADPSTIYTMNSQTCAMSFTNCSVNINTNVPDIGVVAETSTIIERFSESDAAYYGFNGYIYNMGDYEYYQSHYLISYPIFSEEEMLSYIQPVGGASLVFTLMDGQYAYSTGTRVDVVYEGVTIATYYIVVFGDINGDGVCDGTDVNLIDCATQYLYDFSYSSDVRSNPQYYACDASGDDSCDGGDYIYIEAISNGDYLISQDRYCSVIDFE